MDVVPLHNTYRTSGMHLGAFLPSPTALHRQGVECTFKVMVVPICALAGWTPAHRKSVQLSALKQYHRWHYMLWDGVGRRTLAIDALLNCRAQLSWWFPCLWISASERVLSKLSATSHHLLWQSPASLMGKVLGSRIKITAKEWVHLRTRWFCSPDPGIWPSLCREGKSTWSHHWCFLPYGEAAGTWSTFCSRWVRATPALCHISYPARKHLVCPGECKTTQSHLRSQGAAKSLNPDEAYTWPGLQDTGTEMVENWSSSSSAVAFLTDKALVTILI